MFIQKLKFILSVLVLINAILFPLYGQDDESAVVMGTVLDANTNKPLHNVNISILGTLKGAATDEDGSYVIHNVPGSYFQIVVSYVGYETQKNLLEISNGSTVKQDFFLKEQEFQLGEVIVKDEIDEQWRKNLKIFESQFLGILKNSNSTHILNPYIINFTSDDDGWLIAKAKEPILVKNETLGYNISFFLDIFQSKSSTINILGEPFFEDILDDSLDQNNSNIRDARIETYCGSLKHFLHAAAKQYILDSLQKGTKTYDGESYLSKQGFKVYETKYEPNMINFNSIDSPVDMNDFFSRSSNESEVYLEFPKFLKIVYNRESEDPIYLTKHGKTRKNINSNSQISWISIPFGSVLINKNGYFSNLSYIKTYGYWSYELLSSILPYEYSVPDSILENYSQ